MLSQPTSASADPVEFVDRVGRQLDVGSGDILAQVRHGGGAGDEQDSGGVITPGEISSSRLSSASVFSPVRIRWTVVRLNSVLKTRRPSAFRRCSPMGPPAASYVPRVSSRNGEHSSGRRRVRSVSPCSWAVTARPEIWTPGLLRDFLEPAEPPEVLT